ncbi:MAG: phospholipase D-like domain-containing protein [Candidatus Dormibacteraceae bacterium]
MRIFVSLLVLLSLAIGCGSSSPSATSVKAGASGPLWQDGAIFDEVKALLASPGKGSPLWIEMYEFGRSDLASSLIEAHQRGIDVRLIVDPKVEVSQKTANSLSSAGIPVRFYPDDDRRYQIDHAKLLYTDAGALVGGMNWGGNSANNHDYALLTRDQAELLHLKAIFEQDWAIAGGLPGPVAVGVESVVQTTPGEEIRNRLEKSINVAEQSIEIEMYTLTDGAIVNDLAAAHYRGVRVEVIVDPRQQVNRRAVSDLQAAGIEVRKYPAPSGTLLHAKIGLFDDQDLILGSANWTRSGLSANHELDVETKNQLATQTFATRFDEDWKRSI